MVSRSFPYIRESRRILAELTILEQHIWQPAARRLAAKRSLHRFADSVGVGYYALDLHPTTGGDNYFHTPRLSVPDSAGSLIPRRMENLVAGCKNLGTTHLSNGAYRLHPTEWNIGESAGALVAFCLEKHEPPRRVRQQERLLREFQDRWSRPAWNWTGRDWHGCSGVNMKTEKPETQSRLTCCLVTGVVGGISVGAILLIDAAVAGFLHFRNRRPTATGRAAGGACRANSAARLEADLAGVDAELAVMDEVIDPTSLSDAIRLVPPVPALGACWKSSWIAPVRYAAKDKSSTPRPCSECCIAKRQIRGPAPRAHPGGKRVPLRPDRGRVDHLPRSRCARDIQLKATDEP